MFDNLYKWFCLFSYSSTSQISKALVNITVSNIQTAQYMTIKSI